MDFVGKSVLVLAEDGSGSWPHATLTRETDTGLHIVLKNRKGGPGRNGASRLVPWLAVERGEVKLPLAYLFQQHRATATSATMAQTLSDSVCAVH